MKTVDRVLGVVLIVGAVLALGFGLKSWAQQSFGPVAITSPPCVDASLTARGCMNTTAQGIAGAKTFSTSLSTPVIYVSGVAPQIQCSGSGTCTLQSGITVADATTASYTLSQLSAQAANSLVLAVKNDQMNNATIAKIDYEGDTTVTSLNATSTGFPGVSVPANGFISLGGTAFTGAYVYSISTTTLGLGASGSGEVQMTATDFSPASDNGNSLGTGAKRWVDLFLSGAATLSATSGDSVVNASGAYVRDAKTFAGTPTATDCDAAGELGRWAQNTTDARIYKCTGTGGWKGYNAEAMTGSMFVGAAAVAGTVYGGGGLPGTTGTFLWQHATFRIGTAGSGGTTNATVRISDGTNTCDCAFACNSTGSTNYIVSCATGGGGTGCTMAAGAVVSFSFNSIGDCSTGPTIVGNVNLLGSWTG